MDEYIRKKISDKLKGRKKCQNTKAQISQAMKGKSKSQQHKEAISHGMIKYWHKLKKKL